MFTLENTIGFSESDLKLMNRAVTILVNHGYDEKTACDAINDNWCDNGDNTIESLLGIKSL